MNRKYARNLTIYIAVLLALVLAVLAFFWYYAKQYELSMPTNAVNEYLNALSNDPAANREFMDAVSSAEHPFQTDAQCIENIRTELDKDLRLKLTSGSGGNSGKTYSIRCGDIGTIGKVTLSSTKGKLNLDKWSVDSAQFDLSDTCSGFEIVLPSSYRLELNGVPVGMEYVSDANIEYNNVPYDLLRDYTSDLPAKYRYSVEAIIGDVEMAIYDNNGDRVETTGDIAPDEYDFHDVCTEAELAKMDDFCQRFVNLYYKYSAGQEIYYNFGYLSNYVVDGSPLKQRLVAAQDGLSWSHVNSVTIDAFSLDKVTKVGGSSYICDITVTATAYADTAELSGQSVTPMELIVVNFGGDYRVVSMENI